MHAAVGRVSTRRSRRETKRSESWMADQDPPYVSWRDTDEPAGKKTGASAGFQSKKSKTDQSMSGNSSQDRSKSKSNQLDGVPLDSETSISCFMAR